MSSSPDHDFQELDERLQRERPVPDPVFRGSLRRLLVERHAAAPRRIRILIASYASTGLLLILVGAIGLAGVGPFAA